LEALCFGGHADGFWVTAMSVSGSAVNFKARDHCIANSSRYAINQKMVSLTVVTKE
jgi:hypothetical protein